eukprot:g159.t1
MAVRGRSGGKGAVFAFPPTVAIVAVLVLAPCFAPGSATGIKGEAALRDDPAVARLLPPTPPPASAVSLADQESSQALMAQSFNVAPDSSERMHLIERAAALDPWNANANVQLGVAGVHATPGNMKSPASELAFQRLRRAFHKDARPQSIARDSPQGQFLASIIARRAVELGRFDEARKFFDIAASSAAATGHCSAIQQATLVTGYPHSPKHAKQVLAKFHERTDALIRVNGRLNLRGVQDSDPFVFCVMTAFYHEIYYEGDLRAVMRKRYQLEVKAFPELKHISAWLRKSKRSRKNNRMNGLTAAEGAVEKGKNPKKIAAHLQGIKDEEERLRKVHGGDVEWDLSKVTSYRKMTEDLDEPSESGIDKDAGVPRTKMPTGLVTGTRRKKRIKLGIASAFFYPGNSVIADFGGVMDRLVSSGRFDITFVFFKEQPISLSDWDLRSVPRHADIKKVYEVGPWLEAKLREGRENGQNNIKVLMYEHGSGSASKWLGKARRELGALKLDLLLYLDCTMSKMTHRAAMSKLARFQAVSHGHPVTSGIPRGIVNFYVSWANAELTFNKSRHHYTENLVLLPKGKMHQWYEPRVIHDIVEEIGPTGDRQTKMRLRSAINGKPFDHIRREHFRKEVHRAGVFGAGGGQDTAEKAKEAHATMMKVMQERITLQQQQGLFVEGADEEGYSSQSREVMFDDDREEEEYFVKDIEGSTFLVGFDEMEENEDLQWDSGVVSESDMEEYEDVENGMQNNAEEEVHYDQDWEDYEVGGLDETEERAYWDEEEALAEAYPAKHFNENFDGDGGANSKQGWRWYTCMQKPFKRHPIFDKMLARILSQDPKGVLFLHGTPGNPEAGKIMRTRLNKAGVDMSRVHFLPPQPHHALMALYALSDVVLDSYYAGGCTTTREALEVGAPVVTLPAKYLGGRWSLAYYQIMGMASPGQWLVARNRDDYVATAIKVAQNVGGFRDRAVTKIMQNLEALFRQEAAVEAWSAALEKMAGM